jgi:hypothetical protein
VLKQDKESQQKMQQHEPEIATERQRVMKQLRVPPKKRWHDVVVMHFFYVNMLIQFAFCR